MDVILMDIPNIKGESLSKNFAGQIELLSYDPPKPDHQKFTATKYVDKSSPLLTEACWEATALGTVKITVGRNDNGVVLPTWRFDLSDSRLTSVSVGGGSGDVPVETLTLSYSKISWAYDMQKEGEAKATWDLSPNDPGS